MLSAMQNSPFGVNVLAETVNLYGLAPPQPESLDSLAALVIPYSQDK